MGAFYSGYQFIAKMLIFLKTWISKGQNKRFSEIPTICDFCQKNAFFTQKKIQILFLSFKCSSFILKLYTKNRFQIQKVFNEIHPFKIVPYRVCMGVILSKL